MFCEEFNGLIDCHIEYIVHILPIVTDFQNIVFEALAVATLALQYQVGHKLHLNSDSALAFTFLASTAIGVETEIGWGVAHLPGKWLIGKEFTNLVPCLNVSDRIILYGSNADLVEDIIAKEANGRSYDLIKLPSKDGDVYEFEETRDAVVDSYRTALNKARELAKPGDIIIMSNYKDVL